jgi:phospholipid transport system substrate-binding protein
MPSRRTLLAFAGLALLPRAAAAEAGQQEIAGATALISNLAEQALAVLRRQDLSLEQREAAFRQLLRNGFDMNFIARFVLGKHWRELNAEQQAEYLDVFSEYVLQTYSRRLGGYAGQTFAVLGARAAGQQDVIVQTRIDQPSGGPPILADWRVRPGAGGYRIVDVIVEGVSMAVTQRAEFGAVVQRGGVAGLVEALRARTQMMPARSS